MKTKKGVIAGEMDLPILIFSLLQDLHDTDNLIEMIYETRMDLAHAKGLIGMSHSSAFPFTITWEYAAQALVIYKKLVKAGVEVDITYVLKAMNCLNRGRDLADGVMLHKITLAQVASVVKDYSLYRDNAIRICVGAAQMKAAGLPVIIDEKVRQALLERSSF